MDGYLRQPGHGVLEDVARSLYDADVSQGSERLPQGLSRQMLEHIHRRIGARRPNRLVRLLKSMPYVAAAVLLVAVGVWFAVNPRPSAVGTDVADILPGGNRATLTLADGRVINLDEAQTGIIVGTKDITYSDGSALDVMLSEVELSRWGQEQGDEEPIKPSLQNRRDSSTPLRSAQNDGLMMLSLTTPKGGTYQITLPDGSRVWLNAASTLKYPSRFSTDVREVFLEGEAFFEIKEIQGTHDTRVPFKVLTSGQTVEVLGTRFNLSAYSDDEAAKTTLVEGAVQIVNEKSKTVSRLQPGEQSTVRGAHTTVHEVDPEPFIAWRDGLIILDHADLAQVIRQIERWYDVTFDIAELPAMGTLSGEIPRSVNLSQVLRVLELNTGLPFKINGRRVTMAD